MRTLVVALVLAIVSLAGAQVWVAPRQGVGGSDVPGTLQNPYIVYDYTPDRTRAGPQGFREW